jgi:ubiquitin-like-conjugating enzyme ATG10
MTLSEDTFNQQCIRFVRKSQEYADEGWYLSGILHQGQPPKVLDLDDLSIDQSNQWKLLLMKEERRKCANDDLICSYEYSVLYSESYEVPVMYFSASDQNGAHVPLDKILTARPKDLSMIVNQVEHPLLFRPFYMIHPCRTRDFMEPHLVANNDCYLISWLSIISTLLGLKLDDRFSRLDMS